MSSAAPSGPVPVSGRSGPASSSVTSQGGNLKYLGFIRSAIINFYIFMLQIYAGLKDKSGSLKPGIESVESNVKSVLHPIVSKFDYRSLGDEYLAFVDAKVDATLQFVSELTPDEWKSHAGRARAAVEEYQKKGPAATAQSYYDYFRPMVLWYLGALWSFILALPLAPQIINAAQPYAVYFAKQYNHTLAKAKKSDLKVLREASGYLPTIPVEKVHKVE